ncbi:hypothetical protein SLEP1_g49250 [Rubroshorea leprosula]|uniref:Cysteine-rich receptor-like protein kinase n=1 Tax=Rubroshorea leprosula TaxID=152421 RepID=A0AAV5LX68_9ROSI|nr:hypothetical protein SLEP1_g49250 [Rubroshorea leprosula]
MGCSRLLFFSFFFPSFYVANVERLSTQFSSTKEFSYGFYNLIVGQSHGQVNAIGLCRGDIKQDVCKSCLSETIPNLLQICINRIEAVGWSDLCMFRYSNRDIFGVKQTTPDSTIKSNLNVSNVEKFNLALSSLLNNLSSHAAVGDTFGKYAESHAVAPDNFGSVYAYAQCTPDLSQKECGDCLETAIGKIGFCRGSIGCKVLQPSCIFRYETGPFLNVTDEINFSPPSSSPPPAEGKGKGNRTSPTIIVVVVASVIGVLLLLACIRICLRHGKSKEEDDATVQAATNNFCEENKLGQGGYGVVYKGQLPNKQFVAVKRLSCGSEQGEREFKNEVLLVAKLQHRNLVRLLGFCSERKERLLIYEFMPNASLDRFIFGKEKLERKNASEYRGSQFEGEGSTAEIMKCIQIGLLCVEERPASRTIMRSIVGMLSSSNPISLPTPSHPASFLRSTSQSDNIVSSQEAHRSTREHAPPSINEVSITELYPR